MINLAMCVCVWGLLRRKYEADWPDKGCIPCWWSLQILVPFDTLRLEIALRVASPLITHTLVLGVFQDA